MRSRFWVIDRVRIESLELRAGELRAKSEELRAEGFLIPKTSKNSKRTKIFILTKTDKTLFQSWCSY